MAADRQKHDDLLVSQSIKKDVGLELLPSGAAQGNCGGPTPFPFMPHQISPLPTGNVYGSPHNVSNAASHELSMRINASEFSNFPMIPAFDHSIALKSDNPFLDYQVPGFSGGGVNVFTSSGSQTPDRVMTDMHGPTCFENTLGTNFDRNFIDTKKFGVGSFHMSGLDEETNYRSKQLAETNSALTYFCCSASRAESDVDQRGCDNLNLNVPQLDYLGKLDGRFLSLGHQSSSDYGIRSDKYSQEVGHMSENSFCPHGQLANDSLTNMGGGLPGFHTVNGLITPCDSIGNLMLSHNDHDTLPAMTSGFGMSATPIRPLEEANMHRFIPTPTNETSGFRNEIDSRVSSNEASTSSGATPAICSNVSGKNPELMQRRMRKIPFDLSILRSNHHKAADQLQNSCLRTDMMLPPLGGISGGTGRLSDPGPSLGSTTTSAGQSIEGDPILRSHSIRFTGRGNPSNMTSYAGSGEGQELSGNRVSQAGGEVYPPNCGHILDSAGADSITVQNGLSHPSNTVGRESHKRNLDLPSLASTQDQRRKLMRHTLTYPFSPYLLKNAVGQSAIGLSSPPFAASNHSLVPTAAFSGSAAISSNKNPRAFPPAARTIGAPTSMTRISGHPTASATSFVPPTQIPATCGASVEIPLPFPSSTMLSPVAYANTPTIPVVKAGGPNVTSPLNGTAARSALSRTVAAPSGLAKAVGASTASKRVVSRASSPSTNIPPPVSARRRASLLRTSSTTSTPAVTDLRKSSPALPALAKTSSPFAAAQARALQDLASMPRIRWQGPDTLGLAGGEKCMLCKRDLSYTPEGPVSQPPVPPPVAVLPCGHTFHDHCLLLITPQDQSKDPPCIPCAIGEK